MEWIFAIVVPGFIAAYMVRRTASNPNKDGVCPDPPCPPVFFLLGGAGGALFKASFPYNPELPSGGGRHPVLFWLPGNIG